MFIQLATTGTLTAAGQLVLGFTLAIVKDVVVQGDANRTFRLVTLSFLAGTTLTIPTNTLGGDSYPFPIFVNQNAALANRVDLRGETLDLNRNGKVDTAPTLSAGKFTFAAAGSEQDALAKYLADNFSSIAFNSADVSPAQDTRIQRASR